MPPSEKFRLFVIGCLAFLVSFIVIWVFVLESPIPLLSGREISREEYVENDEKWKEIWESGSVTEDPDAAKVRSRVLESLEQYKADPCNKTLREKYTGEIEAFIEDRLVRTSDGVRPEGFSEVVVEAGIKYNFSAKFDEPIMEAIAKSASEGYLSRKDLTGKLSILVTAGEQMAGGAENIYKACSTDEEEPLPEPAPEDGGEDEEVRSERAEEFQKEFLRENRREIEEMQSEREFEREIEQESNIEVEAD